jgi:hypothetical protein
VTYGYDTQGLLTSETRQFSELVNKQFAHQGTGQPIQTSYEIGYSYNLGRQLKRITTPTGDTIDYARDEAGRITGVSGTPRDGVTDYVTDIDYRAWGAEKRYAFGYQNYSITMSHNARMQISRINDQDKLAADYTYSIDGRLSAVQALNDRRLDRTFSYDHIGRITGTRSASEAGLGSAQPAQLRQDYGYDEFNHMTLRQGKYWYTQNNTFSATYTNNLASNVMDKGQAQNWQYDAEGNVTSEGGKTHAFDAVGRRVKSTSTDTFCYDGDGRLVSQSYINPPPSTNPTGSNLTYYLWSTVLKENLAQIRLDGDADNAPGSQKHYHRDVFIYVNGQQVAVRKYDLGATGSQPNLNSVVEWNHRDPFDTIARSVGSSGGSTYSVDPLGTLAVAAFQNEINNFWSPPSGGPTTPPSDFYRYSSANFSRTGISNPHAGSWGMGCALDGVQTSCGTVLGALRTGGLGNLVGVQLHGTPMTPEAISSFSTFTSSSWRRVRIDERTIPGKSPNGLEFEEFPEANLPQERGHIETVAVYEYVGAISGDPVFGGGQQSDEWGKGGNPKSNAKNFFQNHPCGNVIDKVAKAKGKPGWQQTLDKQTFISLRSNHPDWNQQLVKLGYSADLLKKQGYPEDMTLGAYFSQQGKDIVGLSIPSKNVIYLGEGYRNSTGLNYLYIPAHEVLHPMFGTHREMAEAFQKFGGFLRGTDLSKITDDDVLRKSIDAWMFDKSRRCGID